MLHLDLFSGIGGFALAVDEVFGEAEHIFVEWEPFCQAVLKKHWPEAEVYGDIRTFANPSSEGLQGGTGSGKGWQDTRLTGQVDLLTGGFPCQPFSAAGVRRGIADERYLWPEMFRVIRATKPQWVIAENVRGLLTWENGLVFEQVCTDLESEGYEVQAFIIPAVAVNAPHRRDRIWWVATNSKSTGARSNDGGLRQELVGSGRGSEATTQNAQNSHSQRTRGRSQSGGQILGGRPAEVQDERPSWESNWLEVATQFCSVDDGLPVELDGLKLSKAKHRAEQLKAYGNAIVPQIAIEIMKGIKMERIK